MSTTIPVFQACVATRSTDQTGPFYLENVVLEPDDSVWKQVSAFLNPAVVDSLVIVNPIDGTAMAVRRVVIDDVRTFQAFMVDIDLDHLGFSIDLAVPIEIGGVHSDDLATITQLKEVFWWDDAAS